MTLPAIRWAVAYGVVLTTARTLGEFGAVSVVSGRLVGETETMTLHVEERFQSFDYVGAYAASVVLALLAMATLVAMTAFRPRKIADGDRRGVTKRFNGYTALDDVSLAIPHGSLTALLGPSGSGKSTLLRVIAGLEQPDSGDVLISGEEATHVPALKRNVGFVFQHYAAFKHMTVFENVAFGMRIRKRPKAEVKARVHELLPSSSS